MLQNSYSNNNVQPSRVKNYSRAQILGQNSKNYRFQDPNRNAAKAGNFQNFSRSQSVYKHHSRLKNKDHDVSMNVSTGSKSTASHSTGLPPAIKKNSISADYGSNYEQSVKEGIHKRASQIKNKIAQQISGQGGLRSSNRAWAVNGSNIHKHEYSYKKESGDSTELSYTNKGQLSGRGGSKRLNSIGRSDSSRRSSKSKPHREDVFMTSKSDYTIIHVIDENKRKEKDFKCTLSVLLRHMKYFEKHLAAPDAPEDIDISVH